MTIVSQLFLYDIDKKRRGEDIMENWNSFLKELEECLAIDGESGYEETIRQHVVDRLGPHLDNITVDRKGNVLAQKSCGTGDGPVILLNAHLDTVYGFDEGRKILKQGKIWSSTEGILGADDRAGVTILLELARRMDELNFNGKVKFIFTVEEEIGLIGARNIDAYFLSDVDAAFVADRRGAGDIITSRGSGLKLCDEAYGNWIEEIATGAGLNDWKCRPGGSSDTKIWASHGIQSVNLSVGYQNEHTSEEYLDTEACYEAFKLLSTVLKNGENLRGVLQLIKNKTK